MSSTEYIAVLTFLATGGLFLFATFSVSRILRPDKPDAEKLSIYECGEESVSSGQISFNSRFFIVALIFVLFETELIFLFPWAIVFSNTESVKTHGTTWTGLALIEMIVFVVVLFIGLIYAWVKGHLDWIKPETKATFIETPVPNEKYDEINLKYSFSIANKQEELIAKE